MFNHRKPDEPVSPSLAPTIKISTPQAPSVHPSRAQGDGNYSIINEWLTMRGDLESEGDILIKGKVIGNIKCKMLIIDVDAIIDGGIVADEVVIRGRTKGLIDATRVRLEKSAVVDSEICHEVFSAEEGARIKGALKFRDAETRKAAHKSGEAKFPAMTTAAAAKG